MCLPQSCKEKQTHDCGYEKVINYNWKSQEFFNFTLEGTLNIKFIERIFIFLYLNLPIDKYDIAFSSPLAIYYCGVSSNNNPCCYIVIGSKFTNHAPMLVTDIPKFLLDVKNMKFIYREISQSGNVITATNVQDEDNVNHCHLSKYPEYYRYATYKLEKTLARFLHNSIYKRTNYIPSLVNGTVVISNSSNITVLQWDVRYQYDNLTNDSATETDPLTKDDHWSLFTILTYLTLGVSSVSLMATIGVYRYLELFKSTSGIITKHLMGTLLAAQVVFIAVVGADIDEILCLVVALVSHYLWLSAFSWISVFLLGVLKTMKMLYSCPGALTNTQRGSKMVYCLGYGLPSVVVTTSVFIDRFTSIDIGYTDGICFPTGVPGNIFTFALPITIILLINIIVLILSSMSMAKFNSTILQLASVQKVRSYIPVYIKLSVLCAFPWIFGILSDVLDSDILRYVFTVLSGSHGIFVSFVFIHSNNVTKRLGRMNSRNKGLETTIK